jgi:hypothetical protein
MSEQQRCIRWVVRAPPPDFKHLAAPHNTQDSKKTLMRCSVLMTNDQNEKSSALVSGFRGFNFVIRSCCSVFFKQKGFIALQKHE